MEWTSSYGTTVRATGAFCDVNEFDKAQEYYGVSVPNVGIEYNLVKKAYREIIVVIGDCPVTYAGKEYWGYVIGKQVDVCIDNLISESALFHEFGHVMKYYKTGVYDHKHVDNKYWMFHNELNKGFSYIEGK